MSAPIPDDLKGIERYILQAEVDGRFSMMLPIIGVRGLVERIARLESERDEIPTYSHETVQALVDWRDKRITDLERQLSEARDKIGDMATREELLERELANARKLIESPSSPFHQTGPMLGFVTFGGVEYPNMDAAIASSQEAPRD